MVLAPLSTLCYLRPIPWFSISLSRHNQIAAEPSNLPALHAVVNGMAAIPTRSPGAWRRVPSRGGPPPSPPVHHPTRSLPTGNLYAFDERPFRDPRGACVRDSRPEGRG